MNNNDTSDQRPGTSGETQPYIEEIEALRSENAALRAKSDSGRGSRNGSGVRRFFAWFLAIVAIVSILTAATVGWVKTTILDTDAFVATLAPLPKNPAVAEALSIRIGDAVIEASDLEAVIGEALPDGLTFIAVPVASATSKAVAAAAEQIILHDVFTAAWNAALRTTHEAVLVVLTGNGPIVAEEGTVAIDLDTLAEPVVVSLAERGLDLRTLVAEDFTFGRIVLAESDALAQAHAAVRALNVLGWLTVALALLLIAGAMLVAPDRRRQTAILGFGTAIAGLIDLVLLRFGRGLTVGSIGNDVDRRAGLAVWDALMHSLTSTLWALSFLALVIGIAAWLVGPGERAVRLRTAAGDGVDRWRGRQSASSTSLNLFFARWRRPLEWGVFGLGVVVLLVAPVVSLALAVVVVLVGLLLVGLVELIAGPPTKSPDAATDEAAERVDAG